MNNNGRHGHDDESQRTAKRQQLLRTVRALYSLKNQLEPRDRQLLHRPEERYAYARPTETRIWNNIVQPTIFGLLDITKLPDGNHGNAVPLPNAMLLTELTLGTVPGPCTAMLESEPVNWTIVFNPVVDTSDDI